MPDDIPPKMQEILDMFDMIEDRNERIQLLIDIAEGFHEAPPQIAERPFDEACRVPHCESQAFVFTEELPDGTNKYYFAVENPQGISAMATAAILDKACSRAQPGQIVKIPSDVIYRIFGSELSMAKNMGLTAMLGMVQQAAKKRLPPAK